MADLGLLEQLRREPDVEAPDLVAVDATDRLLLDEAAGSLAVDPDRVVVVDDSHGALTLGAAELHGAYLEAIGERNGELHAYLRTVDEAAGDGVPIALKDVISTEGVETTAGSRILAPSMPCEAAPRGRMPGSERGRRVCRSAAGDSKWSISWAGAPIP